MNFPMEYPAFRLAYWLLNTAGIGGLLVVLFIGGLGSTYLLVMRWVLMGARADEGDLYAYPTSTLIGHGEAEEVDPFRDEDY